MAAKPKLTPEQWAEVRARWESDERRGWPWLIDEMGLPVSAEALRLRAKAEAWIKPGEGASLDSKLGAPSLPPTLDDAIDDGIEAIEVKIPRRGVGRPSSYEDGYAEQAYRLCLLGATDADLAESFDVTEATINNWKNNCPEFLESIKRGKVAADAAVAESLFKRATGYSHPDVHISVSQGKVIQTEITKHYPPDTKAAFLWLMNRQSRKWRQKVEVKEEINVNVFPSKEVLDGIYNRALAEAAKRDAMLIGRRERLGIVIDSGVRDVD